MKPGGFKKLTMDTRLRESLMLSLAVSIQYTSVTDRRTDRPTTASIPRFIHTASRGNKTQERSVINK